MYYLVVNAKYNFVQEIVDDYETAKFLANSYNHNIGDLHIVVNMCSECLYDNGYKIVNRRDVYYDHI